MNLPVMIKPASGLCNLRCEYCFYRDLAEHRQAASRGVMSPDTLRALLNRAFQALPPGRNALSLVFQGGEPMLAGLDFFRALEEMLGEMCPPGVRVTRAIQTNGTLIDDEWARFLAEHRYLVGVSLDGPAEIHNAFRADASGQGSFGRVKAGIDRLKRRGAEFNILTVVTAQAARHGGKIYSFLRKNGWDYLQFIPCMDPTDGERRGYSLRPEQYGAFLIAVFREYEAERRGGKFVSVRWFDNLLDLVSGLPPESCGMTGACACNFVAEADGSVYPCDFYADDAHLLGNVADMGFREMFESDAARRFVAESLEPAQKCASCPWYALCRGGCRRYRTPESGKLGPSALCRAYEIFFSACADRLIALARFLGSR